MTMIDWANPKRRRRPVDLPQPRLVGRVACVACNLRADTLLCRECLADIPATRARVQAWLDGINDQEAAAWREWSALAEQHADHWARIVAVRRLPDFAQKAAEHRAKGNIYGRLLDADEAYTRTAQALQTERRRLEKAIEVLEGL